MGIASEADLAIAKQRLARLQEAKPDTAEARERDQLAAEVAQYRTRNDAALNRGRPPAGSTKT